LVQRVQSGSRCVDEVGHEGFDVAVEIALEDKARPEYGVVVNGEAGEVQRCDRAERQRAVGCGAVARLGQDALERGPAVGPNGIYETKNRLTQLCLPMIWRRLIGAFG
jgi:hypothetical protein